MSAEGIRVEVYCDCNHREGVHWAVAVDDGHGDTAIFRGQCGLVGCRCRHYRSTQAGANRNRSAVDSATVGGVSARW